MKKLIRRSTTLLFVFLGLGVTQSQAQIQIGLSGDYLVPAIKDSPFSAGTWGGGLMARYFVSPQFAIGFNCRYLTRAISLDNYGQVEARSEMIVPGLQAEFFLTKSGFKPYIGVESNYFLIRGHGTIASYPLSTSEGYFGAAPKVGIQVLFSEKVGVDLNAGYHLLFSKGGTGKNLLLGAGLVFKLGEK